MKKFGIHKVAKRHFEGIGSGTIVTDEAKFWAALEAVVLPDPSVGGKAGQVMVEVPTDCLSSAFTLLGLVKEEDVRATIHRGTVEAYVPRDKYAPLPVASGRAGVYTCQAIKDDPQWDGVEPEADYVVVTVLAQVSADGSDPVSPHRFAANLAGGNNRYMAADYSLPVARGEASAVVKFAETYIKLG